MNSCVWAVLFFSSVTSKASVFLECRYRTEIRYETDLLRPSRCKGAIQVRSQLYTARRASAATPSGARFVSTGGIGNARFDAWRYTMNCPELAYLLKKKSMPYAEEVLQLLDGG
jgi:hypothetical protein